MRKRIDSFDEYLGSDTDLPFAEWLQQREAATRGRMTWTYALVIVLGGVFWAGLGVLLW